MMGLLFALLLQAAPASPPAAAPLRLDAPLTVDPAVRIGTLPSGITYYLRHNERPKDRVSLRLAVRAGSILEEDDQRGLAHFLEHMAFNGTRNFRTGELVAYLESIGARFGADANAYTSFDETVYMLDVPTDREGLVQKGLLALSDFAARLDLAEDEIEKERGVVLEEWRLGEGAGSRIRRQTLPVLLHGSRYAERLPIGTPEVLRSFRPERLRAFAQQWYRPDRMAVVVVGDLDLARAEDWVRAAFGDIPRAEGSAPLPRFDVPAHQETLVTVATDPEARTSSVSLVFKHPLLPERTVGDYRRWLVERLWHSMMNERFDTLARNAEAPFLRASSSGDAFGRAIDTMTLAASVPEGGLQRGLQALALEAERVRRHGFTAEELDRARRWQLAAYDRMANEREKTESSAFAREYVAHFLEEEPIPGIEAEVRIARQVVPGITLDDVAAATRRLLHEDSRVVIAVAPEKAGLTPPSADALREALRQASRVAVTPWREEATRAALIEAPPAPGRVVARREAPGAGATVLTLSNGAEVWLRPTDFKNDQVLFTAYARGGSSLAEPDVYRAASSSAAAAVEAGFGGLGPMEMERLLAGRLASSAPYVAHYTHGLSGATTPKELETLLQLAHLQFTAPNDRPREFEVLRRRMENAVRNRDQDPGAVYAERVQEVNSSGHYMFRPLDTEDVRALRQADALAFYRRAFANAADFTFFFVGAFETEALVPLVERWLASLPSTGRRSLDLVDRGLAFPKEVVTAEVKKGREPRATATITFFADTTGDPRAAHRVEVLVGVLQKRLRDLLREEMGGTYGVSGRHSNTEPLPGYGTVTVSFGSAPEAVDRMVAAVLEEARKLREEGPTETEAANERQLQTRELEVAERQNGYWMSRLVGAHVMRRDPLTPAQRREWIAALTPTALHEAAQAALPAARYTVVILRPEVADAPPATSPSPPATPSPGHRPAPSGR